MRRCRAARCRTRSSCRASLSRRRSGEARLTPTSPPLSRRPRPRVLAMSRVLPSAPAVHVPSLRTLGRSWVMAAGCLAARRALAPYVSRALPARQSSGCSAARAQGAPRPPCRTPPRAATRASSSSLSASPTAQSSCSTSSSSSRRRRTMPRSASPSRASTRHARVSAVPPPSPCVPSPPPRAARGARSMLTPASDPSPPPVRLRFFQCASLSLSLGAQAIVDAEWAIIYEKLDLILATGPRARGSRHRRPERPHHCPAVYALPACRGRAHALTPAVCHARRPRGGQALRSCSHGCRLATWRRSILPTATSSARAACPRRT